MKNNMYVYVSTNTVALYPLKVLLLETVRTKNTIIVVAFIFSNYVGCADFKFGNERVRPFSPPAWSCQLCSPTDVNLCMYLTSLHTPNVFYYLANVSLTAYLGPNISSCLLLLAQLHRQNMKVQL